jgi:hypothetical protein
MILRSPDAVMRREEAQAPGVRARRPPPCARAGMRERSRLVRLSPGSGPLSAPPAAARNVRSMHI